MADLTQMSALDLLRVEARRKDVFEACDLLAFHLAGVDDLDLIYKPRPHHEDAWDVRAGVRLLTGDGHFRYEPPLTDADLDALPTVGAKVYIEDRDNVADWLAVAERWLVVRKQFRAFNVTRLRPRSLIAQLLAAGRGPSYARRIVESSAQHVIPPLAYGFDLTAEDWDRLASAGVASREALAGYEAAGCTMAEAVDMAAKGVPPGAAVLLYRDGVPMAEWADRAAGIPEDWVPYGIEADGFRDDDKRPRNPVDDGVLGSGTGHTLADLKRYADAGWKNRAYDFRVKGITFGHGRRSRDDLTLTAPLCHRLVDAGLTPADLARWAEAVTMSSQGYRGDADYVPSLSGRNSWSADMLDDVLALHAAGVRPSHVNDYRYAGCRSFADVRRCLDAGITGTRVTALRAKHGAARYSHQPKRITLHDLLEVHETNKQREAAS